MQPITLTLLGLACLLVSIILIAIIRTQKFTQKKTAVQQVEKLRIDQNVIAQNLSSIIQSKTISTNYEDSINKEVFNEMHSTLSKMYPLVHEKLSLEKINGFSLLYTWKGKKEDLEPILLMAHQDVVPIDEDSLPEWEHPPFSGAIADGFIWGRGTLDIKNQLIATLEAAENLLREEYEPTRTIFMAFGHDEEIGGRDGAQEISKLLKSRGVKLAAVVDEGGTMIEGTLPGLNEPAAVIGIAEKGHMGIELTVRCNPGHSSTPPVNTSIGVLSQAITKIEANPMPAHLEMVSMMFKGLGDSMPFSNRMAFANLWLASGFLKKTLEKSSTTNAAIRTTTAPTIIHSGIKQNILPREAKAIVDCRLFPGDSIQDVIDHLKKVINDDRIEIKPTDGFHNEASAVSPTSSQAYEVLARTINEIFGEMPVAPYLMMGGSDSRHYCGICENVYRFEAALLQAEDLDRIHGINERISVQAMGEMVQFYYQLIKNWDTELS
jgi:carboxypeptidase PM20D1